MASFLPDPPLASAGSPESESVEVPAELWWLAMHLPNSFRTNQFLSNVCVGTFHCDGGGIHPGLAALNQSTQVCGFGTVAEGMSIVTWDPVWALPWVLP